MERIHTDLKYETASTEVNTPALEALAQGKGVCQDFAHIMLGCLRSLGLPARYVSGYLLTQPPPGKPRLIGADASHAWVSVYCPIPQSLEDSEGKTAPPSGIWVDYDPTNNRCGWGSPGEDYVTLATGRDFSDVSPMRGVIQGASQHELTVEVTVAPPDEWDGLVTRTPKSAEGENPRQSQSQSQSQSRQPPLTTDGQPADARCAAVRAWGCSIPPLSAPSPPQYKNTSRWGCLSASAAATLDTGPCPAPPTTARRRCMSTRPMQATIGNRAKMYPCIGVHGTFTSLQLPSRHGFVGRAGHGRDWPLVGWPPVGLRCA